MADYNKMKDELKEHLLGDDPQASLDWAKKILGGDFGVTDFFNQGEVLLAKDIICMPLNEITKFHCTDHTCNANPTTRPLEEIELKKLLKFSVHSLFSELIIQKLRIFSVTNSAIHLAHLVLVATPFG